MDERPCLEVVEGELKGAGFPLAADRIVVGSAPECDVCLGNIPGVSRKHAHLDRLDERRWRLTDLGSRNGTLVSGRRIDMAIIDADTRFSIGKLVLRLSIPGVSPTPELPSGDTFYVDPEASTHFGAIAPPGSAGAGMMPAAMDGYAPVAAPGGETDNLPGKPIDAEKILGSLGAGSGKAVLTLGLLAGLVVLALYGASWMGASARPQGPYTRILAVQQEKAISTWNDYASAAVVEKAEGGGDYLRIRDYNGLLARGMEAATERMRQRGYPAPRFLVIQGRLPTRDGQVATIRLRNKAGEPVEDIPVLIVGRMEREEYEEVDPGTQNDRLRQILLEARMAATENHRYLAMRKYLAAEEMATDLGRSEVAMSCASAADRLKGELAREVGDLFQRAIDAYFPDRRAGLTRRTRNDVRTAYQNFEAIKRLIPDETSPDWQVIDYWQTLLRQRG